MNKNSTEKQNFLSCISNQMQLHSKSFPAVFSHPVSHPRKILRAIKKGSRASKGWADLLNKYLLGDGLSQVEQDNHSS
jgi:hypothetical protein